VVGCPAYGQNRNGEDGGENAGQHGDDEERSAFRSLRGWLGDAHGVDKGVRDEQKKFHRCENKGD
jgi:hypothetical protein